MARKGHIGDAAGKWNAINRDLWAQLGPKVPVDAVRRIREIRVRRGGRQGCSEMKNEGRILLAIRDGLDWRNAEMCEVDHIQSVRDGGQEVAANLRLLTPGKKHGKGS